MRKSNSNSKKYLLVVLLLLVVSISIGYAALTSNLNVTGTSDIKKASWDVHFENLVKTEGSKTAEVEAVIDENNTTIDYTVKLSEPGDFYEFTVDVVNDGSIDAMLSEVVNTGFTTDQEKYMEYSISYKSGNDLKVKDILKANTTETIKVRVKYRDDITSSDLPTETQEVNLTFQVTYIQEDGTGNERISLLSEIIKDAVADNIASTYVTSSTGVDFSKISSDTNGKGIYLLASTQNDANPIYYYRGAVTNNNVKFAGFCWKIVRTTETGGVKLIYNGTPDSNGYCTNTTGTSTQIGTSAFNSISDSNVYVGYMYGTAGSGTYEEIHKNINDSSIKTIIDAWYKENMIKYTKNLEDTVWCNDRSLSSGTGLGTDVTEYGSFSRLNLNKTPSLECAQNNDKFTVGDTNGNGALTYPVATITADEMAYAGAVYYSDGSSGNSTYFLYTNQNYWSLSPCSFGNSNAHNLSLNYSGRLFYGSYVNNTHGVRPSVSLAPNTSFISGDGTLNSPYVVE